MAAGIVKNNLLLLGKCVPSLKKHASKILIRTLELDENINMYFKKDDYVYAYDPEKTCKTGDIILIEKLATKMTPIITHKVVEIVYPLGDITDPVTGQKVVVGMYRQEIAERAKHFGTAESAFNYEKAPPRGWQESKKDFSHQEVYVKYHESEEEQPFSV